MKTTILSKRVCVGKDKNNKYNVYLDLNIYSRIEEYDIETIEHKIIPKGTPYKTLSICGDNKHYGGQIKDELTPDNIDFKCDIAVIQSIVDIWNEWHLNDLQPNCCHQIAFDCNVCDYDDKAKIESVKCPNHYEYGSKWLLKEIPQEVIDKITTLFEQVTK